MLRKSHYLYKGESELRYSDLRESNFPLVGALPPIYPENLGSRHFREKFHTRFCYVSGAMARGIASADLVIEVARHGGLGFFGSAGLPLSKISEAIDKINYYLEDRLPFGVNLIHNTKEHHAEMEQVALLLEKGVKNIEAAAFMSVTPAVVWFAFKGIYQSHDGHIARPHHVFAKVSHEHVAEAFLSPPPVAILKTLVDQGLLTPKEALLAEDLPVAACITAESDSGGHTDNRPAAVLFPIIRTLAVRKAQEHVWQRVPFVGLAGGIGTPEAMSSAFDLGADYCVIGSVHQTCVEAGTSMEAKKMLEGAGLSDYTMTPSADMFEEGIKVQVLKKGTLMPVLGNRLREIYQQYASLEELPADLVKELEKRIFKKPVSAIWDETQAYFRTHEPSQLADAEANPKHKMALVFRWYLGKSNQWPITGESSRKADYQIWCGPAVGAFNNWVKGSFLEKVEHREVGQVMLNLLEGAAHHKRIQQLKTLGIDADIEKEIRYLPRRLVLT